MQQGSSRAPARRRCVPLFVGFAALALAVSSTSVGCGGGGGHGGTGFVSSSSSTGTVSASKSTAAVTSGATTGTTFTTTAGSSVPIVVTIKDANGNPIPNVLVTAAASGTNNVITVSGPTSASGVATVTVSSGTAQTETITFTAYQGGSASGTVLTQSVTLTFTPVAANTTTTGSTIAVSPSSVTADGSTAATVTVTVLDVNGKPVSGATVNFTATGTNVVLGASSATTNASGVATVNVTSTTAQSGVVVSAAVQQLGTSTTAFTLASSSITFTAGSATQLAFVNTPSATAGVPFTLTVQIQDAHGNLVNTSQEIALALPNDVFATNAVSHWNSTPTVNGAGTNAPLAFGTLPNGLTGNTIVVAQNGVAPFPGLVLDVAGSFTFGAIARGLSSATTSLTVNANVARQLLYKTTYTTAFDIGTAGFGSIGTVSSVTPTLYFQNNMPASVVTGGTFNPTIVVYAADVFGNPTSTLPSGTHPIQLSAATLESASTSTPIALTGTTLVNLDSTGKATFTGVGTSAPAANQVIAITATDTANGTGGQSATALTAVTTNANGKTGGYNIEVVPVTAPVALKITPSASISTLTAGTASPSITLTLTDASGTALAPRGASVTPAIYLFNANGPATFTTSITPTITTGAGVTFTITPKTLPVGGGTFTLLAVAQDQDTASTPNSYDLISAAVSGITIAPGPGANLKFTQVPGCSLAKGSIFPNIGIVTVATGNLTVNQATPVTPNLQLTMIDAFGNATSTLPAAASGNGSVTLTLKAGSGSQTGTINGTAGTVVGGFLTSTITGTLSGSSVTFPAIRIQANNPATQIANVPGFYTFSAALTNDASVSSTSGPGVTVKPNGSGSANAAQLVILAGPGSSQVVSGDSIEAGNGSNAIVVQVQDAFGTPITVAGTQINVGGYNAAALGYGGIGVGTGGASVNQNITTSTGGIGPPPLFSTDATGTAKVQPLLETASGVNLMFVVTAGGFIPITVNPACSSPFDVLAGPGVVTLGGFIIPVAGQGVLIQENVNNAITIPSSLSPNIANPQNAAVGMGVPVLQVLDENGNVDTRFNGTAFAAFSPTSNPSSGATTFNAGTLAGNSVTYVSGVAVFSALTVNGVATNPTGQTISYPGLKIDTTNLTDGAYQSTTTNGFTIQAP